MEQNGGVVSSEKLQQGASYTYWVREATADAAPLPVPKKLGTQDILNNQSQNATLGSPWNKPELAPFVTKKFELLIDKHSNKSLDRFMDEAGTWEEKNLNKWASDRIKELLKSVGSLEFCGGKAEIADVTKCVGDAFLVIVRNKKRVGYTYELTLKFKGEWLLREEKKMVNGHMGIPEFSFGELDDLQMEVQISEDKNLLQQDKVQIIQDVKLFLQPVREKLLQFEQELRDR